jgi:hypothetical protein
MYAGVFMPEPTLPVRTRNAWQIHFSTAVVLMLLFSILMYVAYRVFPHDLLYAVAFLALASVFGLAPLAIVMEEWIHRKTLPPRSETDALPPDAKEYRLSQKYWGDAAKDDSAQDAGER